MHTNMLDNNALAALSRQAGPKIVQAIRTASTKTGVDFAYLMEKAAAESSFDAKAEAKTSSASGLYQFIERTWIDMVKKYGDEHGIGEYASKIGDHGRIDDPKAREEILALRKDPEVAALMAAEFASENERYMRSHGIEDIGPTELYFAHFMGAAGSTAFLKAHEENPLATAADLFPKAARANYNVFYDRKTGQPRSLAAVYDFFDKKFGTSSESSDFMPVPRPQRRPEESSLQYSALKPRPEYYPSPLRILNERTEEHRVSNPFTTGFALQDLLNSLRSSHQQDTLATPRFAQNTAQGLIMAQMEMLSLFHKSVK